MHKMKRSFFHLPASIFFALVMFITAIWNLITLFTDFKIKVFLAVLLFFILLLYSIWGIKKLRIPVWVQGAFIFLFAMAVRLIWIYSVPTVPTSDFELLYNASVDWIHKDMAFVKTSYFDFWSYQLGYTWFQSRLLILFGEGTFAVKIINCTLSSLTVLTGYLTAKKLFGPNGAFITGMLMACDICLVTMTSVLTNQHVAILLFYFGFYLIACLDHKIWVWVLAGVIIAVGNMMRPLGIVVIAALLVYGLFFMIGRNPGKKALFHDGIRMKVKEFLNAKLILLMVLLVSYFLTGFLINQAFILSGVTDKPLGNKDLLWKFVAGLNYDTKGQYSQKDIEYISSTQSFEERQEKEKELINRRLKQTEKMPGLIKDKFKVMWVNKDNTMRWSVMFVEEGKDQLFGRLSKDQLLSVTIGLDKVIYTTGLIFAFIGAFFFISSNDPKERGVFLIILFVLAYMGAHLIIEIQPRYRMCILPGIYIMAAKGLCAFGSLSRQDKSWSK